MTSDELEFWWEAHLTLLVARYRRGDVGDDPCADCTVPFALSMMAEDRCNGVPGLNRKHTTRTVTPSKVTIENRVAHFRRVLRDKHLDPEHARLVG